MRIACVVHHFPPEGIGGTEVYAWSLAHAVARAGHEVWVFFPSARPGQRRDGDVNLWCAAKPVTRSALGPVGAFWHTFRNGTIEREYSAFLDEVQPDLVHFQHVQGVSALLPALTPAPKVATIHDYWYLCANSQFLLPGQAICQAVKPRGQSCAACGLVRAGLPAYPLLATLSSPAFAYRNRIVRRALVQYDLLISPSHFLRDRYVEQGIDQRRFAVLENGLDHARLSGHPGASTWSRSSATEPLRLVFVGSIAWQKGVHVLIDALNRLSERVQLTIYGNLDTFPDYTRSLRAKIRRQGITLAGPLDHDSVGEALHQADYLIVPSLWYENSPVVIQEAYACGVPVVASDLGALREKVQDGVTGRLFAPGDAQGLAELLTELADHVELRRRYVANIRPGPTVEEHTTLVLEHYQRLIRQARR